MPASLLKRSLRPSDFLKYRDYILSSRKAEFDKEWKQRKPEQYYLAQISYEIYLLRWVVSNMFAKNPDRPEGKLEDFFFKFDRKKKKVVKTIVVESEETKRNRFLVANATAKAAYSRCLGMPVPKV